MTWQDYEEKKKEIQENHLLKKPEPGEYEEEAKRLAKELGL